MNNLTNSERSKSLTKLLELVEGTTTALDDGSTQARQILANEIRTELYGKWREQQMSGDLRSALHTLCTALTPTEDTLTALAMTDTKLLAAEISYDLGRLIAKNTSSDTNEVRIQLQAMRAAAADFYKAAAHTGVHAFIEFTGFMNEFINICEATSREGKDFNQANAHCGQTLNMQTFQAQYIAEKMECIFGSTFNAHLDLTMEFLSKLLDKEMLQEVANAVVAKRAANMTAIVR